MTAVPHSVSVATPDRSHARELRADVAAACARIAPAWPLDRFLAVNPLWGYLDRPLPEVAAELGALSGARLTMPRRAFREAFERGEFSRKELAAACEALGGSYDVDRVLAELAHDEPVPQVLPLLSDLADDARTAAEPQPWDEVCVHQISQHLAAWFDRGQADWQPFRDDETVYRSWRSALRLDRGLPLPGGRSRFLELVDSLPDEPLDCLAYVSDALGLDAECRRRWFDALLANVRGWASACAWRRWEAQLRGGDDDTIAELLAMRAAWEWLLVESCGLHHELEGWRARLGGHRAEVARLRERQAIDWILQHALERAYQVRLENGLRTGHWSRITGFGSDTVAAEVAAEVVFCIDVRSERYRRALEQRGSAAVRTRGFAGFFGLKLDFAPVGAEQAARPQLPGLLAPAFTVTQVLTDGAPAGTAHLAAARAARLGWQMLWKSFRQAATSAFSFVESLGLCYAWKLARASMPSEAGPVRVDHAGLEARDADRLRPVLARAPGAPDLDGRVDTVRDVLTAMGLTRDFPRLVLFAGHGSSSTNNPHAAGLDCGACGGHTGEVNARLLAGLLNEPAVREGLRARGIDVPDHTVFLSGLHDTTTDELRLFDVERVPATHRDDLAALRDALLRASTATRAERAASLGLEDLRDDPAQLLQALRRRASDWSQTRPEWGLANNAAFVVAPRSMTRCLDLDGRVFLHDYDRQTDRGFATLEQILTAPMLVTHWINMQYHCSTVDNRQFGSGNKVLHNVVGGSLGVFEGNGGDLRVGLAMQSLHDGEDWRHTPLRLSVYVAAPRAEIEKVMARHEVVRNLVENGWLYLFQLDERGEAQRLGRMR